MKYKTNKVLFILFTLLSFYVINYNFAAVAKASIHIQGDIYMDETSAVKIMDANYVREFAVNLYDDKTKETQTVWFHYSPADDDPYNTTLDVRARYSWDNFQTWNWFITDRHSVLGQTFRSAWYYALGYSFT